MQDEQPEADAFPAPPARERRWLAEQLRSETVGGVLLLVFAAIGLAWANSPWGDAYASLMATQVGPASLHLDLTVREWAADGLLAIFFLVVGLELKHELVLGSLARPSKAAVPIAAAIGGMVVPALVYVAASTALGGTADGWAVPMATDIAFALAVLAVVGRRLPAPLRAFLLTLAIVDDLGGIAVIAILFTASIALPSLFAAVATLAAYAFAQHKRWTSPWLLVPLGLLAWFFMHASGVHATVAGVAIGLLTRVRTDPGEAESPAERAQHIAHPISAGLAVPLFALAAVGVSVAGLDVLGELTTPIAVGVIAGLVVGKPIGITFTAWLVARFTRASLASSLRWSDVLAVGMLGGIGFTVALLIADLSFAAPADLTAATLAILVGSLASALLAAAMLAVRARAKLAAQRL